MKRIVCLIVIGLTTLALQAQNHFSYSLELVAGVGVGRGPLATGAPQFVAQYDLGGGFMLGAGAGARLARPLMDYITRNGTHERVFCNEFDVPVFLRIGYGEGRYFANADIGYAIGILSLYDSDWIPGGEKETCFDGFFLEPRIGMRFGRHSALAMGVLLQESLINNRDIIVDGHSSREMFRSKHMLTPTITLRYAFLF